MDNTLHTIYTVVSTHQACAIRELENPESTTGVSVTINPEGLIKDGKYDIGAGEQVLPVGFSLIKIVEKTHESFDRFFFEAIYYKINEEAEQQRLKESKEFELRRVLEKQAFKCRYYKRPIETQRPINKDYAKPGFKERIFNSIGLRPAHLERF